MTILPTANNAKTVHELIEIIKQRPALYIGKYNLTNLHSYLLGFGLQKGDDPFDGFMDYCGLFYGKHTTAGWHGLILAECYGDEEEAIKRFFKVYDWYCENPKPINSRGILHKLLHLILIDIRAQSHEKDDKTIWIITNWVHNLPLKLYHASYSNLLSEYDKILQEIFDDAKGNKGLTNYLITNFEALKTCQYEIWQLDGVAEKINKSNPEKESMTVGKTLIHSYLAVTPQEAEKVFIEKMKIEE